MTKIRNVSGEPLGVPWPWLNKNVDVDEVVDVPDEDAPSYLCQETTWAAVTDAPTTTEGDI